MEIYSNPILHDDLINLLHLSVLFLTDKLTEEITTVLEAAYLKPNLLINTWLEAMNLGLRTLENIFFAACLDRFNDISINDLIGLEKYNLEKLIYNENISSKKEHIMDILSKWKEINMSEDLSDHINDQKKTTVSHCFIHYCDSLGVDNFDTYGNLNEKIVLYFWDENDLFEYSKLKYPKEVSDILNDLFLEATTHGMSTQDVNCWHMNIFSRRYNLYFCGGKFSAEDDTYSVTWYHNIWNMRIFRYSLISQKWFRETTMPSERIKMLTVCIRNKIYFIGGRNIQGVVYIVDIYDLHTQVWSFGSQISEALDNTCNYCVNDDKIIICKSKNYRSHLFIYYINSDVWLKNTIYPENIYSLTLINTSIELNITIPTFISDPFLVFRKYKDMQITNTGKSPVFAIEYIIFKMNGTKCEENIKCKVHKLILPSLKLNIFKYKHPNDDTYSERAYQINLNNDRYLLCFENVKNVFEPIFLHKLKHNWKMMQGLHVHTAFVIPKEMESILKLYNFPFKLSPIKNPSDLYSMNYNLD